MPILAPGSRAPAFRAPTSGTGTVDSEQFSTPTVLCFYPGNNTPG